MRDPKAIGSTINFGPRPAIVIGVLPPGVRFPARADVYMPSRIFPETPTRGGHNYQVIGRLRDGVSIEQARDDMTAIARRLEKEYPQTNDGKMVALLPLKDNLVGNTRQMLMVLLAAVSFVLLIACANVANLLLARATARGREMVVRASVGAARWRLVQQLVTESLTLGVIAGVAGVSLAYVGVRALTAVAPQDLPRVEEIGVDRMALWFTLMISVASSVIFGLAPALQVSRVQLWSKGCDREARARRSARERDGRGRHSSSCKWRSRSRWSWLPVCSAAALPRSRPSISDSTAIGCSCFGRRCRSPASRISRVRPLSIATRSRIFARCRACRRSVA